MTLTILVVDDDFATRLAIKDYLELSGYLILEAENGEEALKKVEEYQPQLIVTDILMPIMDGYEFIRRVRCRPLFRLIPVVFLTTRNTMEERIRGYQTGCDNYLPKPFELRELGVIIRSLLEKSIIISQSNPPLKSQESGFSGEEELTEVTVVTPHPITQELIINTSIVNKIGLTEREKEVLELLIDGLSNAQIGEILHLSHRTVEKYVSSLLRKTESNNRAELVRFTMQHHLFSQEP